jgi:sulfite reductase (NADPH) hemoprotein beta-component
MSLLEQFYTATGLKTVVSKKTRQATAPVGASLELLNSTDPFATILEIQEESLAVFVDDTTLVKGLPHLASLKQVVVNIDLQDYQTIVALKDLEYVSLISTSNKDLSKFLVLSHLLVKNLGKPVFHFIDYAAVAGSPSAKLDLSLLNSEVSSFEEALQLVKAQPFEYHKGSQSETAIVNFSALDFSHSKLPLINIKIFRPLDTKAILEALPSSVSQLALIQGSNAKSSTKFSPLLLEFFQEPSLLVDHNILKISVSSVGSYTDDSSNLIKLVISNLALDNPIQNLYFGQEQQSSQIDLKAVEKVSKLEESYITILHNLFGSNLNILNQFQTENINASTPEFGYGRFIHQKEQLQELINLVVASLDKFTSPRSSELVENLTKWLVQARDSQEVDESLVSSILEILVEDGSDVANKILSYRESFSLQSSWLIGSDSWAYDLGSSGVHHILASNANVNLLILDNETVDDKAAEKPFNAPRKKDIGLYAMNYGNAYVGSIAIYSSYTQVLTTLIEATKFDGPSIVLAYLPIKSEDDTPLDILKNTKKAVDSGYIPLYRYNPTLDSEESFKLDSAAIKEQLKQFLDRENKLTLLSKKNPQFARTLQQSQSSLVKQKQDKRAKEAYAQLLDGLSGPPLSIYFASDGGSAESLAKKLGKRALQRGLKATVLSMDDIILEDLPTEENIIFITSTSGQGEFPQNGKNFWDSIKNSGDLDLEFSKISCFGLGDSLYWPRAQDKHYYNKPAKDLFNRLTFLNAKELCPIGLGDDQDADGYNTGYNLWEAELWKALGVDDIKTADEPAPITNEDIKAASNFLRGTIAEGLQDESTGAISAHDQQLTKFHGIYMQDDRDLRDSRKAAGLEPYYIFMARVRLPGGVTTPQQWLTLDKLADETGNGTIKLTTRATYQLHGVVKHDLKHAIRGMNAALMDTLGACGDVNRNVMISALPGNRKVHSEIESAAKKISEHLLPQTTAYHEIWLEGQDPRDDDPSWTETFANRKEGPKKVKTLVAGNALVDDEPFYGPLYLPRKFKINITVPPYNDVDVWSSDVGLIAIIEDNQCVGFNVLVGGGMGSTHNNKKTYPRTGSHFGFVTYDEIHAVCEKIMLVQRDFGNRKDRKNARLKYTVDTLGPDVYKAKVEEYWGKKFEAERAYEIKDNIDHFGWTTDELNQHHFTCFIENGRVENTAELPQKSGLKKLAEFFESRPESSGSFRLTGNQHVLISCVSDEELDDVKKIMAEYKLDNTNFSGLRLSSAACVAFPTCGLAMAEAERYLPVMISKLEEALEEYGLKHDSVVMRMTGCPNGCARPWLAEVALVGKAYGVYNLMLGGGYHGQRLNKIYRQSIKEDEVLAILKPLFKRWALEREEGEHFGDFCVRVGVIKPTLEGKFFHDDIPEQ